MWVLLARVVGFVITAASGWAVSDIYNEHERAKQLDSKQSIVTSTTEAAKANKGKWLFLSIGAVVAFFIIAFVVKPLLMRGKTKEAVL